MHGRFRMQSQGRALKHEPGSATGATQAGAAQASAPVAVIEDDEDTRASIRMLLEDAGYSVLEAADGRDGLALLQGNPGPMVVVLDHRLPVMDGCDLLEMVLREGQLGRHAYVYLTAAPLRQLARDCDDVLEQVDAKIMTKPFDIDHLLAAVADAQHKVVAA